MTEQAEQAEAPTPEKTIEDYQELVSSMEEHINLIEGKLRIAQKTLDSWELAQKHKERALWLDLRDKYILACASNAGDVSADHIVKFAETLLQAARPDYWEKYAK